MEVYLEPITASQAHHSFSDFAQALGTADVTTTTVKGGFAYATIGGVGAFLEAVGGSPGWDDVTKQFLIGIHHAITEPAALQSLRALDNSAVKVFVPTRRLTARAFERSPVFHPKVIGIVEAGELRFLQAGSANLTRAAIGLTPRNHEFSMAARHDTSDVDPDGVFDDWWDSLWAEARPVTSRLIRQYARLRRGVFDDNPILGASTDVPATIAEADHLFSAVGAGSGPPGARHQIEFPESLVRFFGVPQKTRRDLTLSCGGDEWSGRPLSYKQTTYGVDFWRLGMPTQTSGGPPVAQRAILFSRTPDPDVFEFEVTDVGSPHQLSWADAASLRGHLGATGGAVGRQYGFY